MLRKPIPRPILVCTFVLCSAIALAQYSGEQTMFGCTYEISGYDIQTADFVGADSLYAGCGGGGLGFYQGPSMADDRLYICDETGGGGENAAMLIGTDNDYRFTAEASTLDYIVYNTTGAGDADPMGIEWMSNTSGGGGDFTNDVNARVLLGSSADDSNGEVVGIDQDGYLGVGTHYNARWANPANVPRSDSDQPTGWQHADGAGSGELTAACRDSTRMFVGGVKHSGGQNHFAYQAIDLSTGNFVNDNAILLDELGLPNEPAGTWENQRDLRGLAADQNGTYYYAYVRNPADGQPWIYQFDSFPDPSAAGDTARVGNPPVGVSINWLTFPDNRVERVGFACGRMVDIGGGAMKPVLYVLAHYWLYTFTPKPAAADFDGDGIPDSLEGHPPAAGQTNFLLPDSDGDGLDDGAEDANQSGARDEGETDARNFDSDDDQLEDGVEVLLGFDPLDPGDPTAYTDADGDGWPLPNDPDDTSVDTDGDGYADGYEAAVLGAGSVGDNSLVPALGDVNEDTYVSNLDALITQAAFLDIVPATGVVGIGNGDSSRDGAVSNLDSLIDQSFFIGNLDILPILP